MRTNLPDVKLGRYLLRTVCEEDYLDYYDIGRDPQTVAHLSWGPFQNPKEALWTIEEFFLKRPQYGIPPGYAIVDTQNEYKMIGMIDFHTYYESINTAEIGYILHRDYWHQGIMTKCLKKMIHIGFEYLQLEKIIVGHTIQNISSRDVILRVGFHYEYQTVIEMKEKDYVALYYSLYRYEYERM